jgi:hypothetical protein
MFVSVLPFNKIYGATFMDNSKCIFKSMHKQARLQGSSFMPAGALTEVRHGMMSGV